MKKGKVSKRRGGKDHTHTTQEALVVRNKFETAVKELVSKGHHTPSQAYNAIMKI